MAIEVHCGCGSVYGVGPELSGKKIRCRKCNVVLKVPVIPLGESEEPAPPSNEWEPVPEDSLICKTCGSPGKPTDEVCLSCGAPLGGASGPGLVERVPKPVLIGVLAVIVLGVLAGLASRLYSSSHLNGLLATGHEKLDHGDVKGARAAFEEVYKASHDSVPALDGLVQCGVKSNDWKIVKQFGPLLVSKLPKGEKRGRARLDLARAQLETSDWKSAEKNAREAHDEDASLEGTEEIVGLALLGAKETAQAEEVLKKADSAGSKDARVALGLAKIAEDKGQTKEARTWADKAAVHAPQDATGEKIWLDCARLREKDGDAAGALAAIQGACEANPKSGAAKTRLAFALLAAGRPQDAVAAGKDAKALAADDAQAARALGEAYLEANDPASAKSELERAEKLALDDTTIQFDLAKALLKTGDKENGVKKLEAACKKLEGIALVDAGRVVLAADGPPEKALGFIDAALRQEPKEQTVPMRKAYAEARILLARAAARCDRTKNAHVIEERLKQAIEMDPSRKDAYLDLGAHHSELDNHRAALEVLEKGLGYFETDEELLYRAGVEAMKVGGKTYKAAVDHLKKLQDKNPDYKDVKQKLRAAESGLQFEGGD